MRRALIQQKFSQLELVNEQIWGGLGEGLGYDPLELYERGIAPHLSFANASDPLQWHKQYGPLFGCTSAYSCSVSAFAEARTRFAAVLDLWRAYEGARKDLRQSLLLAMAETGFISVPGRGSVICQNAGWMAEATGEEETGLQHIHALPAEGQSDTPPSRENLKTLAEEACAQIPGRKLREAAEDLLKLVLSFRLQDVHPDFLCTKGFEATWTVRDFLQACYLMIFYDITGKKSVVTCRECSQFFYPTSKRPQFCSSECARKSRQRRYWNRRGKTLRKKRRGYHGASTRKTRRQSQ